MSARGPPTSSMLHPGRPQATPMARPQTATSTSTRVRGVEPGAATVAAAVGTPAAGPPWIPNGVRPHSPPRNVAVPLTGTRRNRAVEHMHVFLDSRDLPADDPANFCWLYGAYDYKLQCPPEQARQAVCRIIDRLVERMERLNPPPPPPTLESFKGRAAAAAAAAAPASSGPVASRVAVGAGHRATVAAPVPPPRAHALKGSLIFDIISTKKHIGPEPERGLPFQLGREIYRYADATHGAAITTVFVGLTDNTARRVGRDIFYSKSDELSKARIGFDYVDREHMFIIFPDAEERPQPGEGRGAGGGSLAPAPAPAPAPAGAGHPRLLRAASPPGGTSRPTNSRGATDGAKPGIAGPAGRPPSGAAARPRRL